MPRRRRKRPESKPTRRWRDYQTAAGNRPVKTFIAGLHSPTDRAAIYAALAEVRRDGLAASDHLVGEIYEVKADGERQTFRVLFASEGKHDQVLLALVGFSKKSQKTPHPAIELAQRRLRDWRSRARRRDKPA